MSFPKLVFKQKKAANSPSTNLSNLLLQSIGNPAVVIGLEEELKQTQF